MIDVETYTMRILAIGVLVLALNAHLEAGQRISKEVVQHAGEARTYYLYAPAGLGNEPAPLLLVFHGSGRDGRSLVEKWTKLANQHRFIVAGLDARDTEGWEMPVDGPGLEKALVDELCSRFPVDTSRIYIFGHSAGAVFGLQLALLQSEYFAAGAVHAGSFRNPEELKVLAFARRKIPLMIIVGDRDAYFPLDSVNSTTAALKEAGFPIEVQVVKRHDHWYYDRAHEFNKAAWAFLSSQRLEGSPEFRELNIKSQ